MSVSPKKGLFDGESHANGGIPSSVLETGQQIEIEGDEYYICREAYRSDEEFSFKNKTNKEILDKIYTQYSCKLTQEVMSAGDFIVCKIVVRDTQKHNRQGTVKSILNEMQGEKSCKVELGSDRLKEGGTVELDKMVSEYDYEGTSSPVSFNLRKGGLISNYFEGKLSFLNW